MLRRLLRPWVQYIDPAGFEWTKIRLRIDSLPPAMAGLRIVHLSDLHLRETWWPAYDDVIKRVAESSPDLILITGDIADDRVDASPAVPTIHRFLKQLKAPLGVFAVQGNHDIAVPAGAFDNLGVNFIERQSVHVRKDSGELELLGLPGHHKELLTDEVLKSFPQSNGSVRIILSHYPDHVLRIADLKAQIFLAGHTHGGQICPPGGRPILRHSILPRNLIKGVHKIGKTWLVAHRGLGCSGFLPMRVFCKPQVIEIELARKKN